MPGTNTAAFFSPIDVPTTKDNIFHRFAAKLLSPFKSARTLQGHSQSAIEVLQIVIWLSSSCGENLSVEYGSIDNEFSLQKNISLPSTASINSFPLLAGVFKVHGKSLNSFCCCL
jgi:hypothetical protein